MGHQYGGNTGQGIGGISGRVIPYNLQSTYISLGMDLNTPWGLGCVWHNVVFEPAEGVSYVVTNAPNMVVRTDMASYNSWMAATTPESRGNWHAEEGGNMVITDAPALDQVTGLQDELDGKANENQRIYDRMADVITTTGTNTVIVLDPQKKLYRINATNSTTLSFDTSALSFTDRAATWETWVAVNGTNVFPVLPGTNTVRYLDTPIMSTTASAPTQTVFIAWRAWTTGGVTNIVANPYDKREGGY
jgi:hypothetical protein